MLEVQVICEVPALKVRLVAVAKPHTVPVPLKDTLLLPKLIARVLLLLETKFEAVML